LIALMVYSFARIGSALGMTVEDVFTQNRRLWMRLREKGGNRHTMPYTWSPISTVPGCATIRKGRCSARSAAAPASELRRPGVRMVSHHRGLFERAAVLEIGSDPGCLEAVVAELGFDAGCGCAAADHRVGVRLRQDGAAKP
jgi:hypothetical protein